MPYRFVDEPQAQPDQEKKTRYRFVDEEPPSESLVANIGRQTARTGARVAETALGAPRAFGDFLEGLVPERALKAGAEKIGLGQGVGNLLENTKRFSPYKLFPKSEDIRKNVTQRLFGEKLEPKNEWERKADDLVSDFAALAIPLGGQIKLFKPAALALGGMLASEGVGQLGGTEKQKTYAKLGTILAGSMINPKSAENLAKDLYSKAKQARPSDAKISAKSLSNFVDNFKKELLKGDPGAGSKKKSLDLLKDVKSKIKNNEIDIEELEQFKRDINEARSGLFDEFKTDKVGRKSAKRNLDTVSKFVDNSLKEYGKQNPEWEAFYRPANEVHGAIAQSQKARNAIKRNAKMLGFPTLLVELGLYQHAGASAAIGSLAAGTALLGTGEIMARVMKSPTLRKHYINLIQDALKDDVVVMQENLKKLDKELNRAK